MWYRLTQIEQARFRKQMLLWGIWYKLCCWTSEIMSGRFVINHGQTVVTLFPVLVFGPVKESRDDGAVKDCDRKKQKDHYSTCGRPSSNFRKTWKKMKIGKSHITKKHILNPSSTGFEDGFTFYQKKKLEQLSGGFILLLRYTRIQEHVWSKAWSKIPFVCTMFSSLRSCFCSETW